MASAEQLKALLRSHLEGDDDQFCSVAMQIAAHEAKQGHGKLAQGLRNLIDESKTRRAIGSVETLSHSRDGLDNLLEISYPRARLVDIVLEKGLSEQISPTFPILGVFRLKGQPKRDGSTIVRSCKASQSPVCPIRDAFAVVEHPSCPFLSSSCPLPVG